MKSLNILIAALFVLSFTSSIAQIKNVKTETVKVSGNCGMCKNTIENAGNESREAEIEWESDSNTATISYDSIKTSKSEILKKVALAGYDNELFIAPEDTYASLPGCCQYERATEKIIDNEMSEMDVAANHEEHINSDTTKTAETATVDYLKLVFDDYFEVKDALVKSDGKLTSQKARELVQSLDNVKMNELEMDVHMVWMKAMKDLKSDATKIAESKDEKSQRGNFISLSNNIYSLLKVAKYDQPIYYQFCPMANDGKGANWLSKENEIKNPYYGSAMLSCGKTVETIKNRE
jgi:copper chaperone CopZ/polyhydroxyalkanoate synthesis regulator phasin